MFTNPVLRMEFDVDLPPNEQLTRYLDAVFEHIWRSPSQFSRLVPTIPAPPPVPFLGRVDTARVFTLGVNPCADALEPGHFPERGGSLAMTGLLLDYFDTPRPGSDDSRFGYGMATWERVLNRLGFSYADGSAAHIFLSPRAVHTLDTRDHYLFREMCRYDAPMVLRLLELLRGPGVILAAGELTPGQPVNGFLREVTPEQQWQLLGDGHASEGFAYHSLMSAGACYDVFYSARDPGKSEGRQSLVRGIGELQEAIGLLATQSSEPLWELRVRPEPDE